MRHSPLSRRTPGARTMGGITSVELIVALAVVATLLAIAIPYYQNHSSQARLTAKLTEQSGTPAGGQCFVP